MVLYKEDWPEARSRWEAFWEGEVLDRVCIAVTAPRADAVAGELKNVWRPLHEIVELPELPSTEALYTDVEFIIEYNNALFRSVFWGGEAMPVSSHRLGYAAHGFPKVTFTRETVWAHPWLPRASPEFYQFDPDNRWWRLVCEVQAAMLEDSRGKYFVGWPCIDPPTDVLSRLRGGSGLCTDIIDHPDEVHAILDHLIQTRHWMNEQLDPPLLEQHGSTFFGSVEWGPGHAFPLQCDFSIMISPEHFREFVMPELTFFADRSERCKYHLDGPGALRHLPAILEIDKIKYVQWISGPGTPDGLYWQDVWETVRGAGRGMQIVLPYDQVEETVKAWGPKGLCINTKAPTEEAARDLLKAAERWSCEHPWDIR